MRAWTTAARAARALAPARSRFLFAALALGLQGCAALTPLDPVARQESDNLLSMQVSRAQQNPQPGPRLWFVGVAFGSESSAFAGDIELSRRAFSGLEGRRLDLLLSNQPERQQLTYPFATPQALQSVLGTIAANKRPGDLVVLVLASHGSQEGLWGTIGGQLLLTLRPADLAAWLQPLEDTPTVVIVSACYSGRFIPALSRANRIVLTAASANTSSFGCHVDSICTDFGRALFDDEDAGTRSIRELFLKAEERVMRWEKERNLPQSSPQISIGVATRDLAGTPLDAWLLRPDARW